MHNIKWQSKVTNNEILKEVNLAITFTLLKQRRMRWLDHFVRMNDNQIRKEHLYSAERSQGTRAWPVNKLVVTLVERQNRRDNARKRENTLKRRQVLSASTKVEGEGGGWILKRKSKK